MKCRVCGHDSLQPIVITTIPPKKEYQCFHCGARYQDTDNEDDNEYNEMSIMLVNGKWLTAKERKEMEDASLERLIRKIVREELGKDE